MKDVSRPNSGHSPNLRLKVFCFFFFPLQGRPVFEWDPKAREFHLDEETRPPAPPRTPPLPHRGAVAGKVRGGARETSPGGGPKSAFPEGPDS